MYCVSPMLREATRACVPPGLRIAGLKHLHHTCIRYEVHLFSVHVVRLGNQLVE